MKLSTVTLVLSCLLLSSVIASGEKANSRSERRRSRKQIIADEADLPLPRDCWDLKTKYDVSKDGIYQVYPSKGVNISVLCDMATDGGGWTIFQQRYDNSVNFSRKYVDYENGFGDLHTEFWLGNDFLHQFTTNENQTLRFDLCNDNNSSQYAIYGSFAIGSSTDCYKLHVAHYEGTAYDFLIGSVNDPQHDGQCFSAYDKDQDSLSDFNIAWSYEFGWWFNEWSSALLNAPYDHFDNAHLGLIGGSDTKETVWRILATHRLIHNSLAKRINWSGVHGKRSIKGLTLEKVVGYVAALGGERVGQQLPDEVQAILCKPLGCNRRNF